MKKHNPTTPSRRHMTSVDYKRSLTPGKKPLKKLTTKIKSHGGRNNTGRITVRHQGGGNKKKYRMIDFKQMEFLPAKVESIEYDPYRTAFISQIVYTNGKRAYILAPDGVKEGQMLFTTKEKGELEVGNRMPVRYVPVGTTVYNVELQPGKGGQIAKSAGSSVQILAHDEGMSTLKMPSGETRKISWDCFATIGQVSNADHSLTTIGKAGRSRWLGIRPTVRGTAMNPVDHPYGGGEGKQPRGTKRPKTKWGKVTGGKKTRDKKKYSSDRIIKRRSSKRR